MMKFTEHESENLFLVSMASRQFCIKKTDPWSVSFELLTLPTEQKYLIVERCEIPERTQSLGSTTHQGCLVSKTELLFGFPTPIELSYIAN